MSHQELVKGVRRGKKFTAKSNKVGETETLEILKEGEK